MAKTVENAIDETRRILQDVAEPHRYTDDDLLAILNNGIYEFKRLRPDAWLGQLDTDLPQFTDDPADLATPLPFNTMFFAPLIYYMTGYAELSDDEYAVDGRAATLLRTFSNQLTGDSA